MGLIFKRGNYWIDMDSGYGSDSSSGSGYGRAYGCGYNCGYGYGNGNSYSYSQSYSARMRWVKIETNTNLLKKHYFEEKNAEIRARIIEKIGLESIIANCNSVLLDKKTLEIGGKYKLFQIEVFGEKRVFLKMVNPSTKIFHAEWIEPSIKTVEDALLWRNYGALPKSIT